jgi:hypothetical protein
VERLQHSFQSVLQTHETLKQQNDEIIARVAMEQQFALNPALKGKQIEDDKRRAETTEGKYGGDEGNGSERVGLIETLSRR